MWKIFSITSQMRMIKAAIYTKCLP